MENVILIGLLAALVVHAVINTLKHFMGQGGGSGAEAVSQEKTPSTPVSEYLQGRRDALRALQEPRGRGISNLQENVDDDVIKASIESVYYPAMN